MEAKNENKSLVLEVDQAGFEPAVLGCTQPVLVAFGAPWSRPCRIFEAQLPALASACEGWAKVVKINADDYPELSLWFDVQSIPSLLFFLNGTLRARLIGTASPEAILAKLRTICPESGLRVLSHSAKGVSECHHRQLPHSQ